MPQKRRMNRTSPKRSNTLGLVLILSIAACIGALLGMYYAGRLTIPSGIPAASTAPPPVAQPELPHTRSSHGRLSLKPSASEPSEPSSDEADKSAPISPPQQANKQYPRTYAGEMARANGAGMKVALTFDAGASPVPTPRLLDILRTNGLKVTFFLTGKWCERNEALVKRIYSEGHEIGNHTYSHTDLRTLSDEQIAEELRHTGDIIAQITGGSCAPIFRPPYGGRDKRVLDVAAKEGYGGVYWSLDSWDAFKKGITAEEIEQRVIDRVQGGDIILMHCGSQATTEALPSLIRKLREQGYKVVKVSELFGE